MPKGGGLRRRLRLASRRRIGGSFARVLFGAGLGRHSLGARATAPLAFVPAEPWPGDSATGAAVAGGRFTLQSQTIPADTERGAAPWGGIGATESWRAALHEFEFLRDLRALGGEGARAAARRLVDDWIAHEERIRSVAWRPEVLAHRLALWLAQAEFICANADDDFRARFHASLARQANYLARVVALTPAGAPEIAVHKALIYACLALPGARRRLGRWVEGLSCCIGEQVLGDGGHVARNPEDHLAVLRDLIDVRANLRTAQEEVPSAVQGAIDRMAPMLRFWRHGDGRLALFNGATESRDWLIDMVLTHADARGKPLTAAPHTGFQRLTAHRTLVLMDVGEPPPPGYDINAHAGALAFEFSVGRERLVVNCGAYTGPNLAWREASRTTAAHSTLVVEDVNSAELLPGGGIGTRPTHVVAARRESDGNLWIDAEQNGYARAFGLVHKRRLFLSAAGDDLRGEDTLEGSGHRKLAVRFHLHPDVKASAVQGGASVLLRTASGLGWRMRASGGVTTLQESAYLGGGEARRSDQIVISAATRGEGAQIKWAFSRVSG
jgi:uncharacterized heparinase superfamily protein